MYLSKFTLPDVSWEEVFLANDVRVNKRTCYTSVYPFKLFSEKRLEKLNFEPITILYGGNGSGKTTLLNVIAQTIEIRRGTYFNRSAFFDDYVDKCREINVTEYYSGHRSGGSYNIPKDSQMITSDDVFDYLLDLRCINEGIDKKREDLLDEYTEEKYSRFQMKSISDFERLKKNNEAKRLSGSQFVRKNVMQNLPEKSNGESAFFYFTDNIKENALYLLDEPENSLAAGLQLELQRFIEDSARFFGCQFVIATHSPFLLSMQNSIVYDMDSVPIAQKKWTELENVRVYYEFFKKHKSEF